MLFGISSLSSKILIFALLPLYTRTLTTTEYGQADLLINLVYLSYPLLTLSVAEGVLRFAFDANINRNEILSTGLIFVTGATLFLLFLTPASSFLGHTMSTYWGYFVAIFLGYGLQNLFALYCRGRNKVGLFAAQGFVQTVSILALTLLFLLVLDMGIRGFLLATTISYYITLAFIIFHGRIIDELTAFRLNFQLLKEILTYSIPLALSMTAWWINAFADRYIVIALLGFGASGIYSAASKIPIVITLLADIFNQAFLGSAVASHNNSDRDRYFNEVAIYFIFAVCFLSSVLISLSASIGGVLFSGDYSIGWTYVPILSIAAVFYSFSAFLASFFRVAKKTKLLLKSTLVGSAVNVAMNFILIPCVGTIGAAYATVVGFLVVIVIRYFSLKSFLDVRILKPRVIAVTLLLLLQGILMSNQSEMRHAMNYASISLILLAFHAEARQILTRLWLRYARRR